MTSPPEAIGNPGVRSHGTRVERPWLTAVTNQKNVPIETCSPDRGHPLNLSNDSNTSAGVMPTTTDTPAPSSAVPDAFLSLKPEAPAPGCSGTKGRSGGEVPSREPASATEEQLSPGAAPRTSHPRRLSPSTCPALQLPPGAFAVSRASAPRIGNERTNLVGLTASKPSDPNAPTPNTSTRKPFDPPLPFQASPRSRPRRSRAHRQSCSTWPGNETRSGKALDALVAYRVLERTHPATSEAQIAVKRIKELTEKLEVDTQERGHWLLKQARSLGASENRPLALGFFFFFFFLLFSADRARLSQDPHSATRCRANQVHPGQASPVRLNKTKTQAVPSGVTSLSGLLQRLVKKQQEIVKAVGDRLGAARDLTSTRAGCP